MSFEQSKYEGFYEDYSHCDKEGFGLLIDDIDFDNESQVAAACSLIIHVLTDCRFNVTVVEEDDELYFYVADVKVSYEAAKRNLEDRRGVGYVFDCYVTERSLNTALGW
ncbi:hypothetical protein [Pseudomonas sp. EA_15y_Pfl2_R67]|uniref:hypothetical protein n=1 Tax=Pseudomonas sp. EA_15y_Pfl2_R67 TaxID=3088687 RepID=UPI0030DB1769